MGIEAQLQTLRARIYAVRTKTQQLNSGLDLYYRRREQEQPIREGATVEGARYMFDRASAPTFESHSAQLEADMERLRNVTSFQASDCSAILFQHAGRSVFPSSRSACEVAVNALRATAEFREANTVLNSAQAAIRRWQQTPAYEHTGWFAPSVPGAAAEVARTVGEAGRALVHGAAGVTKEQAAREAAAAEATRLASIASGAGGAGQADRPVTGDDWGTFTIGLTALAALILGGGFVIGAVSRKRRQQQGYLENPAHLSS